MNVDEFLPYLPEHVRVDFICAVAEERMRADWKASKAQLEGYEIGVAQQVAICQDENHKI